MAFAGEFEPDGWMTCDGRLLQIRDYLSLYALLGSAYGGDGLTTFGIPDLRGRVPMGSGAGPGLTNRNVGERPGAEAVILDVTQLPAHSHELRASNRSANERDPTGAALSRGFRKMYSRSSASVTLGTDSVSSVGSNAPHANMQPFSVINFIICVGDA